MKQEMLINVAQPEECRIAIVEDGQLEELYVERTSQGNFVGNIYKGKIVNLEPAIQAAFVDFSVGRNGFLHVSDVEPQYYHRHAPGDEPEPAAREPRRERDDRRHAPGDEPEPAAREPRRERDDRRRGRGEDREPGAGPPGRAEERHRERPDRSERGRRDRSEPRRFGEGLTDDDVSPPPPAPPRPVPVPAEPPTRAD